MSLLREIQQAAVSGEVDVCTLLRKCKILAFRLGNAELKEWVDNELNGYQDASNLPPYRRLDVQSFGDFSGFAGRGLRNAPIPPSTIPEALRTRVTESKLMQPISAYSALLTSSTPTNPQEYWSADLVAYVGQDIYQNMNCISAWKLIPLPAIVALVDTIKTRILNFSLELEAAAPEAGDVSPAELRVSQERIAQVFNTFITGSVQNVATGGTNVSQSASASHGTSAEVFAQLLKAIDDVRPPHVAAPVIVAAVEAMRDAGSSTAFGEKYKAFMSILSDHIGVYGPVVAPFLPSLAALFTR